MDNKQVTAEWIAQQRAICNAATQGPWESKHYGRYEDHDECCIDLTDDIIEPSKYENADFIVAARTALPTALDALEAAYAEIAQMTAERDAEKKRADAATEINLRPLQPGYMGVCTTDDEDGIQIRKVSHKHPQGRGYLDDDEDVQDVVVIRFADTAQVLAVVDRLLVLADAMAEKTRQCAENTDAPTGTESE
jgi:hypothetical protein